MELELIREYFPAGTNGAIYYNSKLVCCSIELPWKNNESQTSCVPEGKYELTKRYSPKFKQHLLVEGVGGRDVILIHPANDALKELKGCIAPVTILKGEGRGSQSRSALEKISIPVLQSLERKEPVLLTIKCKPNDN